MTPQPEDPSKLYDDTLQSLYSSKSTLRSQAWASSLTHSATPQQRIDSAAKLIQVQNAIEVFSAKELNDIAVQLSQQEAALNSAIAGVNAAIKVLKEVQTVLDTITQSHHRCRKSRPAPLTSPFLLTLRYQLLRC